MIEIIHPSVFNPFADINALFTLSNRQVERSKNGLEGLNFGINTTDSISVIKKNRTILADVLEMNSDSFVFAEQVHGDHIEVVREPGFLKQTDGLITQYPNLILAIQVADCAAVFVADVENNIIGVFHAGWRGAAAKIASKGVKKMISMAEKEPTYFAYISPCISKKNFEVGPEVAVRFSADFVDYVSYEKPHINLKAYLRAELISVGVQEKHIEVSDTCTMDDAKFYSYRRERDKAGRMLACMYINKKKETICE